MAKKRPLLLLSDTGVSSVGHGAGGAPRQAQVLGV